MRESDTERRLARLEALFLALFLADTDLPEDRDFTRHLLRRMFDRPGPPFPFWHEFEELLHMRPRRFGKEVEALREEVERLRSAAAEATGSLKDARRPAEGFATKKDVFALAEVVNELQSTIRSQGDGPLQSDSLSTVKQDLYAFVALQALGTDLAECPFHRPLPLRVYLKAQDHSHQERLSNALKEFAGRLGFGPAAEFPEESGSWFKRWFVRSKTALTQPEMVERLNKAERALEMVTLHRHQAEVDRDQATGASSLLTSLEKVPNAVCQIGSILVVKMTDQSGPKVFTRTLSQLELIHIEKNQHLLRQPDCILDALSVLNNSGTATRGALMPSDEVGG